MEAILILPQALSIMSYFKKIVRFILQSIKFSFFYTFTRHWKYSSTGLLIIRNDHLGDLLVSLPSIKQAADFVHNKSQKITVIVSPAGYEILKECPYIDNLEVVKKDDFTSGIIRKLKAFRKITKYRAKKTVLLLSLGRSGEHDYAALLPKSKERYVLETAYAWKIMDKIQKYREIFFNLFYTKTVAYDINKTLRENEAALLSEALKVKISPETGNVDFIDYQKINPVIETPFYIVVPGASNFTRQWPAKYFALIIDHISANYPKLTPVISGSTADTDIAEAVKKYSSHPDKIINICGKSNIQMLFANIKSAEFIITNDTAPYHIAGIFEKKCFCIGGNWQLGAFTPDPYYKSSIFINHDTQCKRCLEQCKNMINNRYGCLMQVTVEQVKNTIDFHIKGKYEL